MVTIEAKQLTWNLKLTINATCALEEKLREIRGSDFSLMDLDRKNYVPSLREIRAFFWAFLLHSKPQLTVEEAGEILDEIFEKQGMDYVMEIMVKTMNESMGMSFSKPGKKKA
jgi:hypothetical protein